MRTKGERVETSAGPYVPLAARVRPRDLDELVGHASVLGEGKPLRVAIERGEVTSLILWGPPGVGKTTLAEIIARRMEATIERVSAVTAGVKDLRAALERAKEWRKVGKRTVLIVDEIHRFNKAQQDVLLPSVEEGLVTLIGATTENPYFEVITALASRAEIVKLSPLADEDVGEIVQRASGERLTKSALGLVVKMAAGDARRGLNLLERALLVSPNAPGLGSKSRRARRSSSTTPSHSSEILTSSQEHLDKTRPEVISKIGVEIIQEVSQQAGVTYDKGGDMHYDIISAFIKSMRGSDADAALFYLFRMLAGGEDPKFIMRRMFIFASEDVGNADPHALMVVDAAARALEWVGLPEAEYNLAQAATYLAAAPKSNSVTVAMGRAKEDVAQHGGARPPGHITNAPVKGMQSHGAGIGYKYPHDFPGHVVAQQYRPDVIQNKIYYEPGDLGFEKEIKRRLKAVREELLRGQ